MSEKKRFLKQIGRDVTLLTINIGSMEFIRSLLEKKISHAYAISAAAGGVAGAGLSDKKSSSKLPISLTALVLANAPSISALAQSGDFDRFFHETGKTVAAYSICAAGVATIPFITKIVECADEGAKFVYNKYIKA